MITYREILLEVKIGDKVRITKSRTGAAGGKTFDIIVKKIINKNLVSGEVLTGHEVGMTNKGYVVKKI